MENHLCLQSFDGIDGFHLASSHARLKILEYMDILNEVDTENVELTSQVTGLNNVMRKDEVSDSKATREELLDCSELPKDSKQIRVLPAIK